MRLLLPFALLLSACGGSAPTAPEIPTEEPTVLRLAPVPAYFEGFYVEGRFASEPPGSGHVYIMSWGDDLNAIQVPGFVSTHCCLWSGGRFDSSQWNRIEEEWLRPLMERGLLMGVYLVDEPNGYGISDEEVARGAEFVRQRGYPTMAVRQWGNRSKGRLPVDYYGVTAYSFTTKKEWVRDFNREADTDFIVGQAFDARPGYEKGIPDQRYWRETARQLGKPIISWSWRWPGQYSCGDDTECVNVWVTP